MSPFSYVPNSVCIYSCYVVFSCKMGFSLVIYETNITKTAYYIIFGNLRLRFESDVVHLHINFTWDHQSVFQVCFIISEEGFVCHWPKRIQQHKPGCHLLCLLHYVLILCFYLTLGNKSLTPFIGILPKCLCLISVGCKAWNGEKTRLCLCIQLCHWLQFRCESSVFYYWGFIFCHLMDYLRK